MGPNGGDGCRRHRRPKEEACRQYQRYLTEEHANVDQVASRLAAS